jgi:hypothetical protein
MLIFMIKANDPVTSLFIARAIGLFFFPLGSFLGLVL